ncbi:MAG: Rrf2 family transcriptional regulator [Anaerolineales bacterium]
MLKINRQTDYAVRVVLALSKRAQGTRVSSSEIGREMQVPPALLQRIVAELASGGYIHTQAGRDGGITLAHLPKDINLLQVVEHFEGVIFLSDCALNSGDCPFGRKCPVRCQWVRLKNLIRAELERVTFQQLVEDATAIEFTLTTSNASLQPIPVTTSNTISPTSTTLQ